jgi:hypothetical protein
MLHAPARETISRILAGDGFADRALALTLAGSLAEIPVVPAELCERALSRSLTMTADHGVPSTGNQADAPIPNDERELSDQIAPQLSLLVGSMGRHTAALHALIALWPHVGGPERAGMRRRFLNGATKLSEPVGGEVTVADLRAWQRDLPTSGSLVSPSVASLSLMLNEPDQRRAYHALAEHLGASLDPATLSWVLGGLAVQELLHRRDRTGGLLNCLLGAMAINRIAHQIAPEHAATLITQISLQLWWWRHHGNLAPIRSCLDGESRPLADAVRSGDITAAQRAARAGSADPSVLWNDLASVLDDASAANDAHWLRALSAVTALAWRSGDALSPDDVAATATVLADLCYHDKQASIVTTP